MNPRHRFGICMYGIQYATGAAGRGTAMANPDPLAADALLALAIDAGLSSVEVPLTYVSADLDVGGLTEYTTEARRHGVEVVVAGPNIMTATDVERQIKLAGAIGATRFRCTSSGLLCGDREPVGGLAGWGDYKRRVIARLRELAQVTTEHGVRIGVENHQDCDSYDLVEICDAVGSSEVGVTLDTGNPLSVAEDPIEFARRVLPFLVDVHLKDYRMINTNEGYRLVHCAIGSGVIDFAALWPILEERPEIPRGIEMAALSERHIRIFTQAFWDGLGPRDARTLAPVMKLVRDRGESADDESWQTPIERWSIDQVESAAAVAWETARLRESIANLSAIESAYSGGTRVSGGRRSAEA